MLGSINPLGERARGSRWGVTAGFFAGASVAAGATVGAVLGLAGSALLAGVGARGRLVAFGALVLVGTTMDLRVAGMGLPTTRRQVNEDWLGRYRGWVVGAGFGAQLGVGVATIVTTSAVYATLGAALLAGSAGSGLLIGMAFGAARALTLVGAARADDPARVAALDARFRRWEGSARTAAVAAQLALASAALALALVAA